MATLAVNQVMYEVICNDMSLPDVTLERASTNIKGQNVTVKKVKEFLFYASNVQDL